MPDTAATTQARPREPLTAAGPSGARAACTQEIRTPRALWAAASLPHAAAGVRSAASAAAFLPRGPRADGEREQWRAGDGLGVLQKHLLLSSGGRELSQRDDDQGHKHRCPQESGNDNGTDSSGPQRACRDREMRWREVSRASGSQSGRAGGGHPHPARPQPPGPCPHAAPVWPRAPVAASPWARRGLEPTTAASTSSWGQGQLPPSRSLVL